MRTAALPAILLAATLPGMAHAETPLPVPEGFSPIAPTLRPDALWLMDSSVRSNVPIVTADILSFSTDTEGQPIYVRSHFVAHCDSGDLSITKQTYFGADSSALGINEQVQNVSDAADRPQTLEGTLHKELCDRQ